jgi:hypothetical protein
MCPQRFAPKTYDAAKLAALQDAYDETWKILRLRFPSSTKKEEECRRAILAKCIVDLSMEGVFDGRQLFRRCLKTVLAAANRDALAKPKSPTPVDA